MPVFLQICPEDDVVVALRDLPAGTSLAPEFPAVRLSADIPAGHKIAVHALAAGSAVRKYGSAIGIARRPIAPGDWVHSHNLRSALGAPGSYVFHPLPEPQNASAPAALFPGFRRQDGRVGIRNEIWILPTVGCVCALADRLAERGRAICRGRADAVVSFRHPYGCSQLGEDEQNTRRILADLALHPNAGGVLVLGLGCENSGVAAIREQLPGWDPERVRFLEAQACGDELAEGLALVESLLEKTARDKRTPCLVSELTVGLKCGGSDGFSGLTANPLAGCVADRLVSMGAGVLLSEVPEMFGAEQLLMDRCISEAVFRDTCRLIEDFQSYYRKNGQPIHENPSPGNKQGGITTLEEKSLGCVQKAGRAPVAGVLDYGARAFGTGLRLVRAPGNDAVSSTALAAAGAQLILFTTGRGTPFGCAVPTLKIASNSALAAAKPHWIDFDAGSLLAGQAMEDSADALFRLLVSVVSGRPTKAEQNGCREIAIFKTGVTL